MASDPGYLSTRLLATSTSAATTFSVRVNGTAVENVIVPTVSGGYNRNAEDEFTCTEMQFNSGNTNVAFNYSKRRKPKCYWLAGLFRSNPKQKPLDGRNANGFPNT